MSRELNANTYVTIAESVAVPGTAEQLAAHAVPDGLEVILTARITNTGDMYVGFSQTFAQSGPREIFPAGRSAALRVDDTARIWVDADEAADVLEVRIPKISAQTS